MIHHKGLVRMLESELIEIKPKGDSDHNADIGILILKPHGALDKSDFERVIHKVDDFLKMHIQLHSVLIYTEKFPGWTDFSSLISHFKFIRLHHQHVQKVALITDTVLADAAQVLLGHFIKAELKHFPFADYANALVWAKQK
jgi:hypothetical protein